MTLYNKAMRLFAAFLLLSLCALAQPMSCACDHVSKAALDQRNCGLCGEVEKAPGTGPVVFVKDNSPLKPNRWLALPRRHTANKIQVVTELTQDERTALWREAIGRAKETWGDKWGLAMNGVNSRGQCHVHVHIGRLIDGVEWGEYKEIGGPEEVPDPGDLGLWIHPVANGKLHVHVEMSTETVLAR